jgi:hypothetical protein
VCNVAGCSPEVTSSAAPGAPATPDAPALPTAVLNPDGTVTVTWQAPNDNGRPIDRYAWQLSSDPDNEAGHVDGDVFSTTLSVAPGSNLSVRVLARNAVGWGTPSAWVSLPEPAVPTP